MNPATIAQKLWNYCNDLRDDGMSYGDYVEAASRQLLHALLYLLHPCSRAHPCARGIRTPLFPTRLYLLYPCSRTFRHPWRSQAPYNQKSPVPSMYSWPSLIKKDGDDLFDHYRHTLEALGNQKGLLGLIFNKSQTSSPYAVCI